MNVSTAVCDGCGAVMLTGFVAGANIDATLRANGLAQLLVVFWVFVLLRAMMLFFEACVLATLRRDTCVGEAPQQHWRFAQRRRRRAQLRIVKGPPRGALVRAPICWVGER